MGSYCDISIEQGALRMTFEWPRIVKQPVGLTGCHGPLNRRLQCQIATNCSRSLACGDPKASMVWAGGRAAAHETDPVPCAMS